MATTAIRERGLVHQERALVHAAGGSSRRSRDSARRGDYTHDRSDRIGWVYDQRVSARGWDQVRRGATTWD